MGLPSVVVGLVVYLLLSRAGPLGRFGILFTPTAMVIAQTILITPTIAALSRQIVERRLGRIPRAAALARRGPPRRRAHAAVGSSLLARHDRARGLRPRGLRSRRGDDRGRQHRRRHARDDDRDRARNEQGRPAAGARPRLHPARDRAHAQRRGERRPRRRRAVATGEPMDMRPARRCSRSRSRTSSSRSAPARSCTASR